jgi:hypothetical protein
MYVCSNMRIMPMKNPTVHPWQFWWDLAGLSRIGFLFSKNVTTFLFASIPFPSVCLAGEGVALIWSPNFGKGGSSLLNPHATDSPQMTNQIRQDEYHLAAHSQSIIGDYVEVIQSL